MIPASSRTLSDEQLMAICEYAEVISCKCPAYLARLLQQAKQFRSYTTDCNNSSPSDAATHEWLGNCALQMEAFLIQIIFDLMERENLLDEQGQPDLERLGQYSRLGALQQMSLCPADAESAETQSNPISSSPTSASARPVPQGASLDRTARRSPLPRMPAAEI